MNETGAEILGTDGIEVYLRWKKKKDDIYWPNFRSPFWYKYFSVHCLTFCIALHWKNTFLLKSQTRTEYTFTIYLDQFPFAIRFQPCKCLQVFGDQCHWFLYPSASGFRFFKSHFSFHFLYRFVEFEIIIAFAFYRESDNDVVWKYA